VLRPQRTSALEQQPSPTMTTIDRKRLTRNHTNKRNNWPDPVKSVGHTTPRALRRREMHHRSEDRTGRTLFWLQDVAAASSSWQRRYKKSLNKERKPSHRREVVVRHASKALRPLQTGRTDGFAGEGNGTLDAFFYDVSKQIVIVFFLNPMSQWDPQFFSHRRFSLSLLGVKYAKNRYRTWYSIYYLRLAMGEI
jgi:hypothetical protein